MDEILQYFLNWLPMFLFLALWIFFYFIGQKQSRPLLAEKRETDARFHSANVENTAALREIAAAIRELTSKIESDRATR